MSEYYQPKRTKNLFDPAVHGNPSAKTPFKLSRSKIDLFIECPRCFYLDRRLGVGRPPGFPFNLNSAVDHLLKKEFDTHRAKGTAHPLMKAHGVNAVPFQHQNMTVWRENFVGVQALHKSSGFLVFGAVDDVWVSRARGHEGELIVADYKATSKDSAVNLDAEWQDGYKRQMEVYQWLLRQNGFNVSDTGYFVYANGRRDRDSFDAKLEFEIVLLPYTGSDAWIEKTLLRAKECLMDPRIPEQGAACDYCNYVGALFETLKERTFSKNIEEEKPQRLEKVSKRMDNKSQAKLGTKSKPDAKGKSPTLF